MIRNARITDVPEIHGLITMFAERGLMLFRSPTDLYEDIRSFLVYEKDGRVVGCCALEILWRDMAEIRSLAVDPACQGEQIGSKLVQAGLEEAFRLGVPKILSLTYRQTFFERLGFAVVSKKALPHKVWTACIGCPKQACCDEIPMLLVSDKQIPPARGDQATTRAGTGIP